MNTKVKTIAVSLLCVLLSLSFLSCEADTGISGSKGGGVTGFQLSSVKVSSNNTASGLTEYIIKYNYDDTGLLVSALVCDVADESKIKTLSPTTAKDLHHVYTYDTKGNRIKDDVYTADANADGTIDSTNDAAGQYNYTEYTYDEEKGLKLKETVCMGTLISQMAAAPVGTPIVAKSYSYDTDNRTTVIAVRGFASLGAYPANYAAEITTNIDKTLTYEGESKYPSTEVTTVSLNGLGAAATQLKGNAASLPVGFVLSKITYEYDKSESITEKNTASFNGASYSLVNWTMKYTANKAGTSSYLTEETSTIGSAADTSNIVLGDGAAAGNKVVYTYDIEKGLLESMEKQDKDGNPLKEGKYHTDNTYDATGNHVKEVATTVESDSSVTTTTYEYSYEYVD